MKNLFTFLFVFKMIFKLRLFLQTVVLVFFVLTLNANASTNVALNKPATASASYAPFATFGPHRAVDGLSSTWWSAPSQGTPQNPHWIMVDLQGIYQVERILLEGPDHPGYDSTYYVDYILEYSIDNVNWYHIQNGILYDDPSNYPGDPIDNIDDIILSPNLEMRYVKVTIPSGNHWAHLVELEVYSSTINQPPTDILLSNENVDENSPVGTVIGMLSAFDPDIGETFTFSEVLDPDSKFSVVGDELRVDGDLDFENAVSHDVTIRVTDSGGLSFDKLFTINVNDVNETPTDIALSNSSVEENSPVGTVIGTVSAMDPDAGESFTFSEVLDPDSKFSLVGDELLVDGPLDFETVTSHEVTIRVTDSGSLTFDKLFTVTVTDVNEAPTLINNSIVRLHFDHENGRIDSITYKLGSNKELLDQYWNNYPDDPHKRGLERVGTEEGTTVTDWALYADSAYFRYENPLYGSKETFLKWGTDIGFEMRVVLNLTATRGFSTGAHWEPGGDNGSPYDSAAVYTSSGWQKYPMLYSGYQMNYQDSALAAAVWDSRYDEVIGYRNVPAPIIQLANAATIDGPFHYGLSGPGIYTIQFAIKNRDAFWEWATPSQPPTNIFLSNTMVDENSPIGTVIGMLSADDPNPGETFTFSEVLDPDSKFSIVGEELLVDGPLDFETTTSHEVTIRVTDSGSLTFDKLFTITVLDVNEAPTDIEIDNSSVAENEPVGTLVGTFNTIDPEGGTFTYSLVPGTGDTDNGSFTIDGDQLKTAAVFDYETQNTFSILVRSVNGGSLFIEKVFTITATDVNETPTDIALSNSSVEENTPIGTVIGTISATDPDAGETFTFSEVLDPDSKFSVVGDELLVDGPLDFETVTSHDVTVRVTDSGSLTYDKLFTITVLDVNEEPTDIELSNSSVAENEPVATVVGTFNTIDPEGGTFTYSLVSGTGDTDNGSFTIDGDQLKTNEVFDYETQNSFSIRVHSENGSGLFIEEIFTITVTDANEPPIANAGTDQDTCSSGPTEVTLDGTGSSDPNSDPLSYTWYEGTDVIATGVNPTVSLSLGTHTITLTVDDGNGGMDTDEVIITVNELPTVTFNTLGPFSISDPVVDLLAFVSPAGGTFSGPGISGTEFNPSVAGAGTHTLTYSFTNVNGCINSAEQLVLVISTGTITGTMSENGDGLEGITVKLLDLEEMPTEFDDQYTDANGQYSFTDVPAVDYLVMMVEPLGYSANINPKLASVTSNETIIVDFTLTKIVLTNKARSKGYLKHQFDVYVTGRGHAQETEDDLQSFIEAVHQHYDPHFPTIFGGLISFEDWQEVLSVSNNSTKLEKAKQHLAALVLNLASLKIGQYIVVTKDDRTCGDALTYASILIENPDATDDELELAKDIAEDINNHKLINAGIVPQSSILYKGSSGKSISWTFDVPEEYTLYNNFPNPFNPTTTIRYGLPEDADVTLKVYSLLGEEVATLIDEHQVAGAYQVKFFGGNLASGIYIYRIHTAKFTATKKLMLMK